MEIFKNIKDYENLYQISNLGNVLSLAKGNGNGYKNRLLKQETVKNNHTNYKRVTLCKDGKTKRIFVHRLVGEHFISNPKNAPDINHIDNIGWHNETTNLEWVTKKENMAHSSKQGRQDTVRKLGCKAASEKASYRTKQKFELLLGNNFLSMYKKDTRTMINFNCSNCLNTFTRRSDARTFTEKNGICNDCYRQLKKGK